MTQSAEEYKQKERERARLNRQKQKEQRTRTEEDVRTEDVRTPRTRTEDDEELPPEMQAIAAKVQQPEEDINVIVLKERIVLIEKDLTKARDLVMRQLMQLKGRGWHIVELSARYIS